jgi:hypothetical protein
MAKKKFPKSELPIRETSELLPNIFQTPANKKFMEAVVDPLVQPGVLEKTVGYVGRRYGKTYRGSDVYLDTDRTLRSRYQLEPAVVSKNQDKVESFYDYIDFKNQLKFFGNQEERDNLTTNQEHYSWNPPIDWDKFVNYREYYWVPSGPPAVTVLGNRPTVTSSYSVILGTGSSFIFRPDGFTNNPTITLYRGQTYKFKVNAPGQGFVIRSNYDSASLRFNSNKAYEFGNLVVFDDKLWRALGTVLPGNTPFDGSPFWTYVDLASSETALDYNKGVTNNGTENGTVTFKVPYDAPDFLYYQSKVDADRFGRFIISKVEEDTRIDIDKEIIGKSQYTSSNGVPFSNGLVIEFRGRVAPEKYSKGSWLVEGVGTAIQLISLFELEVPAVNNKVPAVIFDNNGFDTEPFDDASNYPGTKDYFTINRTSIDRNPWSRYNRWFHRSVLEFAYKSRGQDFPAPEADRAKRPIIEFLPNLQLFNHGAVAKDAVDYVETVTSDIFSIIEGSDGYIVDGEPLFDGARLLIVSDTDNLTNNKIYEVKFITHLNRRQIALRETPDSESLAGQCLLVKRGRVNSGLMYHFNGVKWIKSQQKISVNQPPLFDAYDENDVSYSDPVSYPINNFKGTKILSYKSGNGPKDSELGISLSYQNIDNVGDIVFEWNWGVDNFLYTKDQLLTTQKISKGYYRTNLSLTTNIPSNGWINTDNTYIQPIIDSVVLVEDTNQVTLTTIDWDNAAESIINFYLNSVKINESYTRDKNTFTFEKTFLKNDVLSLKVITTAEPVTGYYEIPVGLERNPLNQEPTIFTFGQAADHVSTAVEFDQEFVGVVPGVSNLRDLSDYIKHAKRFMKHSALAPLSVSLLCDKNNNIVKSLQYAKKSYTNFKNNFLIRAVELAFNDNIPDFVDEILSDLTRTKTQDSSFFDSDMIGTGAYTSIDYTVADDGIRTFALSEKFTLKEQSRRAVYVYINNVQVLNGKDYEFNETFGFITVKSDVVVGDKIQIREYVSTSSCFIPATPTKLGLYKKYTPLKFVDDTYLEPKEVIQGHDGSITFTYGDFRDDLLLELEYRIYNNIKQEYNKDVFDIDSILGGYYGSSEFTKEQLDSVVNQEFLRWIQNSDVNYTVNSYFKDTETFTYTYSNMADPTGTKNLPGYWRGVYQWFYDTDRPHRCPWEMLGFSQQPDWWEAEYGPAPYTGNNLVLWEDLSEGIIRQGPLAGRYERYRRPSLINHIPVDGDGNLLSPLDSGLATNFVLINNKGNFKFGDINPAEYAWRSSSEWPFSVMIALSLLKPFDFIPTNFDRTKVRVNKLSQNVNIFTNEFVTISDLEIPSINKSQSAGLVNYLVDYAKSKRIPISQIESKIKSLDVVLSTRLSGFADKSQQRYLLDSKNPRSSSSSVFVPPENYDIIFNVSTPVTSISYSGVLIEKTDGGWILSGYDNLQPFFNYYQAVSNQKDPIIQVGGVSETFSTWTPDTTYNNGQIVLFKNDYYRSTKTHRSGVDFESSLWRKLPDLPVVGGTTAFRRRNFNNLIVKKLVYGSKLTTVQEVVDFLLGYEHYLKSQGFKFDRYDKENQVSQNWLTSCKEFMFWTKQNWAIGSLITLSPAASTIELTIPVGVADNLLDSFYDYQIFKSDGNILDARFINVSRTFQNLVVETTNTTEGIYFIRVHFVLKEHVAVFTDKTVFNDVIYDKTTGYRQERIKTQGFRTTDWDGDYTSPGFLFDNVNIETWQPFTDYKLGDIVEYQSRYWTSQENQLASETFDPSRWSRLDLLPQKQLVANFDYKINQFDDYYEVSAEGIGQSQRDLARHAIGYQERRYLQELAEDPVTQFQLYQGFIREKGTFNSITKVFDKLSKSGSSSIKLDEEWAFRVGRFGGVDQVTEIEFKIQKDKFVLDPQAIVLTNDFIKYPDDQYYRVAAQDFTISPQPYTTNVNPVNADYTNTPFKTAGYVRTDQVDLIIKNIDDLLSLNVEDFSEGDHVWVTFDSPANKYWSVRRIVKSQELVIVSQDQLSKDDKFVSIIFDRPHNLVAGEIIGINGIENLTGFFKVSDVTDISTIVLEVEQGVQDPVLDESTIPTVYLLEHSRYLNYGILEDQTVALMPDGSKLWIDNNGSNRWEVVEKKKQFLSKKIENYGGLENTLEGPLSAGYKVVYDEIYKQFISSVPGSGYVLVYSDSNSLPLRKIIESPASIRNKLNGSFGKNIAISPDSQWMVISAPNASNISSNFVGNYSTLDTYEVGSIVYFDGKTFRALEQIVGDGSTITIGTDSWEEATLIETFENISGLSDGAVNQGMIFVYRRQDNSWERELMIVSPRVSEGENFGHSVAIGQDDSRYFLAVSAIGAEDNRGRVYFYEASLGSDEWKHSYQMFVEDPESQENDLFGFSIALNRNSNILAISSPEASDESTINTGKVYLYQKDSIGDYFLNDIISASKLDDIDDSDSSGFVASGDQFGYSLAIDSEGFTLVISSPKADLFNDDQGAVYVLKTANVNTLEYRLKQKIYSFQKHKEEFFGKSVAITPRQEKIIVGASNKFIDDDIKFAGSVYVFELKDNDYFLTEKLEDNLTFNEGFGYSISSSASSIVVGSPNFENGKGTVRLFKKKEGSSSWEIISSQQPLIDIDKIKSISLFDTINNIKIGDVDFIDPAKGKILNIAEQEIKFKTPYDPAFYSLGTSNELQTVDASLAWTTQHIGELWWDISTAKWVYYEQGDVSYRSGNWSQLAVGASIDVYEWVESPLLPSEWSILADTNEGVSQRISGQPKNPDDTVYSVKQLFNDYNGQPTGTLYYYWVKNTVVVPENVIGRRISADQVSRLIEDPKGSGERIVSIIAPDQFLSYNFAASVTKDGTVINIEYYKGSKDINVIHNEYQLLTEGDAGSLPTVSLEAKWIDSLIGYDSVRNPVPDPKLPAKQKYGISFRPRQSMFVNRETALQIAIEYVNQVLKKDVFADFINMSNLQLVDSEPAQILNLYDQTVDTEIDLNSVITSRLKPAILSVNILDGEVDTIDIIDPGFGYKIPPPVILDGNGKGAKAQAVLDLKGRIQSVNIISRGKRYTVVNAEVRPFSVLVKNDSVINGFWSIYAWDEIRKVFYRTRSQSFDTRKYWSMIDWWKDGYSAASRIVKEIITVSQEPTITVSQGDLIRIREYGSGGWAVFERNSNNSESFLDNYSLVGREKGTIELSRSIYDRSQSGIGYDATRSFDIGEYDIENFLEVRNILKAVKEDIFVGDYSVEWNKLFFSSIRYAFSEQQYVDWAFKTSFLNAIHNVGKLEQKLSYQNDSLSSFQDYIHEVKPYRTTIREYVSKYSNIEKTNTSVTDFDLPAVYSKPEGKVIPVNDKNDLINDYPWKWWADNNGYSVVEIRISDPGEGYVQPPTVLIEGNGFGASARAYIVNGKVSTVVVTNVGFGYTKTPTVSIVGGNAENPKTAKAVAIIGDSKVRNFRIGVKFDRITKEGKYQYYSQEEEFTASGVDAVFPLTYPSSRDKSKIEITLNGQVVLDDEYKITLYTVSSGSYKYQLGKVIFNVAPLKGDHVKIVYEKDDAILDSVNRINKHYSPKSGMKGKDIPQLMTGIDFGGVQVQGSSFGLTGGWDSLPWYSDTWDSVDPSGDFYYIFTAQDFEITKIYRAGSSVKFNNKIYQLSGTEPIQGEIPQDSGSRWQLFLLDNVTLPYIPAKGNRVNIYRNLKNTEISYDEEEIYFINDVVKFKGKYYRCTENVTSGISPTDSFDKWLEVSETFRVDDPAWTADDSSMVVNPNAMMPTFEGNGTNNIIDISQYFTVLPGEILIFRPEESDGSNNIINSDVLDTNLAGGSFAGMNGAFITAQGITAEEIVVEGGVYVSPDFVPAPEENVPGQVLDSLTVKVFHTSLSDSSKVSAFEIHKDMLNLHYFKRYSLGQYVLAKDLNYYDTEIILNDATGLIVPATLQNVPGTITIGGERIEFLHRNGVRLRRLRRGVQGTSVGLMYPAGTPVVNISYDQTIPYREETIKNDFFYDTATLVYDGSSNSFKVNDPKFIGGLTSVIDDGEEIFQGNKENIVIKLTSGLTGETTVIDKDLYEVSVEDFNTFVINIDQSVQVTDADRLVVYPLLIGPLEYIPKVDESTVELENNWYRNTIPTEYGQCNEIEVFVGGRRNYKSNRAVYSELKGVSSPLADITIESDFSVDGKTSYIRLTNPVENAGTRITVIKRTGTVWYERGVNEASKGVTLLENSTPPARFIAQKTTKLPE